MKKLVLALAFIIFLFFLWNFKENFTSTDEKIGRSVIENLINAKEIEEISDPQFYLNNYDKIYIASEPILPTEKDYVFHQKL